MKQFIFIFTLWSSVFSNAQSLEQFNKERIQIDKRLMVGLGSWATTNIVVSGIGWASVSTGEALYFHQMNVMWNTLNIGLAIPGYVKAKKANAALTFAESILTQHKTEKLFLINTGLDIGYISGGLLLRSAAKTNTTKQDQFKGYGTSLLLQGGFLFVFDLTASMIHNRHSKKSLDKLLNSVEMSSTGLGLQWNIQPKGFSAKKQLL